MPSRYDPDLVRGSLDLMVLSALADAPRYGYLLQQRVREATQEQVPLPAGTLYPLLHRLESEKLISSTWDASTGRRRKWYDLTARGRARLEKQAREWVAFTACVHRMLSPVLEQARSPRPASS
jgi:DNA-binding PadR family transcriptional regulator